MNNLRKKPKSNLSTLAKVGSLSLVATGKSNAEVIALNLSNLGSNNQNITGNNAGISYGQKTINNVLGGTSGNWQVWNNTRYKGIGTDSPSSSMSFFVTSATTPATPASPRRFSLNATIGSTTTSKILSSNFHISLFFDAGYLSPNFSSPNNYLGFYDSNVNKYGWLQATWNGSTNSFTFVAGAYENTPGVSIRAGAVPVPEPGTLTLGSLALLVSGGAAVRRYRKQRQSKSANSTDATNPVTPVA
jgi:hypothetical protein